MQNQKTKKIQRLRGVALDENEAPKERIIAAAKLLTDFGPTERNVVVINKVVKLYANDSDYSVQERCLKLKDKLVKARGLRDAKEELPEDDPEPMAVEETPAIVAGVSASEVPKPPSIFLTEVVAAHQEVLGGFKWRQFNEGIADLSKEERLQLLKAILGDAPSIDNVRTLFEAVHVKNGLGWTIAGSCPSIGRIAGEFLNQKGVSVEPPKLNQSEQGLLDRLNRRVELGVPQ
jgi:hypothetical protein